MNISLFYHSVVSDWNNGDAHFLRGIISSLSAMGHRVTVFEPKDAWSMKNMLLDSGITAYYDFMKAFPFHKPVVYRLEDFNPEEYLADTDLVLVHEWNHPELVRKIGDYHLRNRRFILLFHDTRHRPLTKPGEMSQYDLSCYDGVLASGEIIRDMYRQKSRAMAAWTWYEAADDRIFHPVIPEKKEGDLVWIGNWGDNESTEEIEEFIIDPVRSMKLSATFFGVRYPVRALKMLSRAGIRYKGWLPNYRVPEVFSKYNVTVHITGRTYVESLPGIPTIRPFEAMACGIPLICSPWNDTGHLFSAGEDYLVARDGEGMKDNLKKILSDSNSARSLAAHGLETIRNRHTCDHRAVQLMNIFSNIKEKRIEKIHAASASGVI